MTEQKFNYPDILIEFREANRQLRFRNGGNTIDTIKDCEEIGLNVLAEIPHDPALPQTRRVTLLGPCDCPV